MEAIEVLIEGVFDQSMLDKFTTDIEAISKPSVVVFEIKSEGGYCEILEAMCEIMLAKKSEGYVFVTSVEEYAYSCAFVFFMLGDMKFCSEQAKFLYHAAGVTFENRERITALDAKEIFESLDYYDKIFDKLLLENTDISNEMFSFMKKNETSFDRNDLLYFGLIKEEYELNY